ncbi:MAG: MBL fold metallo-hydrolase [Bacteroidia bacterium]
MRLRRLVTNPYQENTYLLIGSGGRGWIIDPGFYTPEERQAFQAILSEERVQLEGIYLTHAHIDHILGVAWVAATYGVPVFYHRAEEVVYRHAAEWASYVGLRYEAGPAPQRYLEEGERLLLDGEPIEVLYVPGHSPGHVAFYLPGPKWVISGDVLFRGSIGNYELPLADYATLMRSLREVMLRLEPETVVWPGHGESTTIGYERQTNPFLVPA